MPDDLTAASSVVVHAAVRRLQRETARRRACNERVKAPAFVIDLDNVAGLDPLEPHHRQFIRIGGQGRPARTGTPSAFL